MDIPVLYLQNAKRGGKGSRTLGKQLSLLHTRKIGENECKCHRWEIEEQVLMSMSWDPEEILRCRCSMRQSLRYMWLPERVLPCPPVTNKGSFQVLTWPPNQSSHHSGSKSQCACCHSSLDTRLRPCTLDPNDLDSDLPFSSSGSFLNLPNVRSFIY